MQICFPSAATHLTTYTVVGGSVSSLLRIKATTHSRRADESRKGQQLLVKNWKKKSFVAGKWALQYRSFFAHKTKLDTKVGQPACHTSK